jgi:hypothetical protein
MRATVLVTVLLFCSPTVAQQSSKVQSESNGTISGRVTNKGEPASGVDVLLATTSASQWYDPASPNSAPLTAKTDADGRYTFSAIAAGSYLIRPFAPAYTVSELDPRRRQGKTVIVSDGETVEGLIFL